MNMYILLSAGVFTVGIVLASFFEHWLHSRVMHKPLGKFRYPFERHALIHHNIFKADDTYHLQHEKDKETIPMAWWNGPVMISLATLPFAFIAWATNLWEIPSGICAAFTIYYGSYEYLHWCMHLPRKRRLEMSWIFQRLNGHHLLHHRYMHRNFNVVLPLADLVLGTFTRCSKTHFKQAPKPAPWVQPLPDTRQAITS